VKWGKFSKKYQKSGYRVRFNSVTFCNQRSPPNNNVNIDLDKEIADLLAQLAGEREKETVR